MKKTLKFISMAALAVVGAVVTSCSSDDLTDNTQQRSENNVSNVVTLTTTVGRETRALDIDLENQNSSKTFAVGECMAVVYENTSGAMVRAVSEALTSSDIADGSKSATFTVTLTDPKSNGAVKYIYPAAMSTDGGNVNYSALSSQNGTLDDISSLYDLGFYEGNFVGDNLPTATLVNELSILALTLKNDASGDNITSSITGLTVSVSDGKYTYNVSRAAAAGPIYVAIRPTTSAAIEVTATDGTKTYVKALADKTYYKSNVHPFIWRMAEVIKGKFSVSSTRQVYFSKGNLQATGTVSGSTTTWTWAFAEHQWDKIGGKDQDGSGTPTGNNLIIGNGKLSASGTVDLFGWSTNATHLGIHNSTNNSDYSGDFVDWGDASEVTDCIGTGWRTMSNTISGGAVGEWDYLLTRRTTTSGMRFYKAQVSGVSGLIVFPDDWKDSYHPLTAGNVNNNAVSFESTKITESVWNSDFEAHGAVFLPVAGQRHVNNDYVEYPNGRGHYWSSTPNDAGTAYRFYFTGSSSQWSYSVGSSRRFGYSVRLVRNVK